MSGINTRLFVNHGIQGILTIMDSSLKNLPVHQRIRLVEDLWDSIASDQNSISLSSAQKAELDRRLEAYEVTKDPGRPADKVISEIRKKL